MGLDMYAVAFKRDQVKNPEALVDPEIDDEAKRVDIAYWRKFNALHGWMEDLYRSRDGADVDFNCVKVRLTAEDLDQLEDDLNQSALKPRAGFFFGSQEIYPEDVRDTHEFIAKAREALDRGDLVYYDSWW